MKTVLKSLMILILAASLGRGGKAMAQESSSAPKSISAKTPILRFLTNGSRPYVMMNKGVRGGEVYELVDKIAAASGYDYTISLANWSATYNRALSRSDALIFPLDYTEERKDMFQWVAPILTTHYALYSVRGKYPKNIGLQQLIASGATVGCSKNTIHCVLLKEVGFPDSQIMQIENLVTRVKHKWLIRARGDLTIMDPKIYQAFTKKHDDMDPMMLDQLMMVASSQSYLAANKDMDPAIVEHLKEAVAKVKATMAVPD